MTGPSIDARRLSIDLLSVDLFDWEGKKPNLPGPPISLNIGCANRPLDGYVNMDMQALPGVDLVYRIDPFYPRLPFWDDTVRMIEANNFVEHIADVVTLVRELWRFSVDGAQWHLLTPGYVDPNSWNDPGHLSHWSGRVLEFFTKDGFDGRRYGPALISVEVSGADNSGLDFRVVAHKPGIP